MAEEQFRQLLETSDEGLPGGVIETLVRYRDAVVEENKVQNLTRILEPKEFFEGHLLDCFALLKSGLVEYPAMDLGSGVGVPGIPMCAMGTGPWVLSESEGKKAEFLKRVVNDLSLPKLEVFSGRAEDYFRKKGSVKSVVARAVGPVERIYGWIRGCSTWNNLVLLKGPGWQEEWKRFLEGKFARELIVAGEYEYSVGPEKKHRVIIRLERKKK